MVYYPRDVLEKRVKKDEESTVVFYDGETVGEHYPSISDGFKRSNLRIHYYSHHSNNLKYITVASCTLYSMLVDSLREIDISEKELEDMLTYVSESAQGTERYFDAIKYNGKVRLSSNSIDFWKVRLLDDMSRAPLHSFLCNTYRIIGNLNGKVVVYNSKGVTPKKLVNVYSDGTIKVTEC